MKIPAIIASLVMSLGIATAKEGAVQCGNLIYAGTKTSKCFSDEFLTTVQQKTSVSTERRFKPVKLSSEELFKFPFVIMTGEGDFTLTSKERENMKKYLENGGFLLASPGCSNKAWATAFEREIKRIFDKDALKDIPMDHALFKTIFTIKSMKLSHGGTATLHGITHNDKLVVVYSSDGLNDTSNTEGCCC
ncbi:protein of unknown function [Rubritalea squalenifaciens DSM 18772]|uniref:DUF4159 domain-containing protein n=1 Tax=Rubritalea squalenifaciens DSM 18772 TaxID=1123071 RepID=A0A1M6ENN1_9BACT|nr:DUF4159 domain-containing protein [Rubritalea squalenifaciens]SHI87127.1 protein of unknown function [Rubritalea squalenifaciens DSM 18772]